MLALRLAERVLRLLADLMRELEHHETSGC
jgi:hypothetical protein